MKIPVTPVGLLVVSSSRHAEQEIQEIALAGRISLGTSYRRRRLDRDLTNASAQLDGLVLDLGGEILNRRGSFCPPEQPTLSWVCINLDPAAMPDIVADIARVPVASASAGTVVCTEVLEHVWGPESVLSEAHRLLQAEGRFIGSMPFLVRLHADPHDFQRYTDIKLERLLQEAGFTQIHIERQGGYFLVLADIVRAGIVRLRPALLRWTVELLLLPLLGILRALDSRSSTHHSQFLSSFTTGYMISAVKR